eukprot:1156980-Pelagomonas_calceolata.AAC.9
MQLPPSRQMMIFCNETEKIGMALALEFVECLPQTYMSTTYTRTWYSTLEHARLSSLPAWAAEPVTHQKSRIDWASHIVSALAWAASSAIYGTCDSAVCCAWRNPGN